MVQPDGFATWDSGLTKRELFIALALQATLPGSSSYEAAAMGAVFAADATLAYLANESDFINAMKSRAQEETGDDAKSLWDSLSTEQQGVIFSEYATSRTYFQEKPENVQEFKDWIKAFIGSCPDGLFEIIEKERNSSFSKTTTGIAMIPPLKDMG